MTRVRLVPASQAPLLALPYYAGSEPGPIVGALAHVPEFLETAMPFVGTVLGPSAIDARTKELVILRTSAVMGCSYCVGTHTVVALDVGLDQVEVRSLRGEIPIEEAFERADERAVLAWTDAVASGRDAVSARDELAKFYDDADIVELTVVAATTAMLNKLCTALDLPVSNETTARLRDAEMS